MTAPDRVTAHIITRNSQVQLTFKRPLSDLPMARFLIYEDLKVISRIAAHDDDRTYVFAVKFGNDQQSRTLQVCAENVQSELSQPLIVTGERTMTSL